MSIAHQKFTISVINKAIKNKDIITIKTLMSEDGNVSHHVWFQILKFVSEYDMLHSIKSPTTVDHVLFSNHIDATQATLRESFENTQVPSITNRLLPNFKSKQDEKL